MCNDNYDIMRHLTPLQNICYDITGNSGISLRISKWHWSFTMMRLFVMNWLLEKHSSWQKGCICTLLSNGTETNRNFHENTSQNISLVALGDIQAWVKEAVHNQNVFHSPMLTTKVSSPATDRTVSGMALACHLPVHTYGTRKPDGPNDLSGFA